MDLRTMFDVHSDERRCRQAKPRMNRLIAVTPRSTDHSIWIRIESSLINTLLCLDEFDRMMFWKVLHPQTENFDSKWMTENYVKDSSSFLRAFFLWTSWTSWIENWNCSHCVFPVTFKVQTDDNAYRKPLKSKWIVSADNRHHLNGNGYE